MTPTAQTDPDFVFEGIPPIEEVVTTRALDAQAAAQPADPLGPLAQLPGTWTGHGFNTIWRPHHPSSQDRFLELNLTTETLVFTKINGPIPNRGLLMPDISMFGITYMQQISQTSDGTGLHIEPGIWATVPATTSPSEPATVVRMASIPHGTVILAQAPRSSSTEVLRISQTTTSSPSRSAALRRRTRPSPRTSRRSQSSTYRSRPRFGSPRLA